MTGPMVLEEFKALAPAGHYLAIRVGFAFPMVEHNGLPPDWVREYAASGLLVHDPAMAWIYRGNGITRMSDLEGEDRMGVFDLARVHGLTHGAAASHVEADRPGERSFGFFFRGDRAFSRPELERLSDLLVQAHRAHEPPKNLTAAELETLGLVKNGLLSKQIAGALGISESAVKQRLRSARVKLKAKTGSQAAAKATMLGMI